MPRYSDEIIEEVRQSNDIVDIISQYMHLKRSGRNYFGLCPFHNEKSPSFSVSPDKQIFHCFGCGVGGNVFTFLMKIEGISFIEAVQSLAERANIQLPTFENSIDSAREELKAKVYKVNEFTATLNDFPTLIQGKSERWNKSKHVLFPIPNILLTSDVV